MERRLSKEVEDASPGEKLKILNTYSSNSVITLSGFVGSLITVLAFFCLLSLFSLLTNKSLLLLIKEFTLYGFIFILVGVLAGKLRKLEYKYQHKVPLVYIFFVVFLFAVSMSALINLVQEGKGWVVLNYLALPQKGNLPWVVLTITLLFCSLTFANPLERCWDAIYNLSLKILSNVDYQTIYGKNYFSNHLRTAFYNARRYNVYFSVITFRIANFPTLKKLYNRKGLTKIRNEIFSAIKKLIRETDVVGYLGEGELFGIMLYAGGVETHTIAERIKSVIENDTYLTKTKKVEVRLNYNLLPYSKNLEGPEEMIRKAIPEVEDARQGEDKKEMVIKI